MYLVADSLGKIMLTCFQFAFRVVLAFFFFLECTLFGAAAPLLHLKRRQCELWSAFWYSFSLELCDKYTLVHVYRWPRDHEVVWVYGCNSDIKTVIDASLEGILSAALTAGESHFAKKILEST